MEGYFLGQAVKRPEGWEVSVQGKNPKLSADEITIIEQFLNSMESKKLNYHGTEISVSVFSHGRWTGYEVVFPNGETKTMVPFEVAGQYAWGFQNDGVSEESIELGKFVEENAFEISYNSPVLTWEQYTKETQG